MNKGGRIMLYFDYAATSIYKPETMVEAVIHALTHFGNSGRGTSEVSMSAAKTILRARMLISELINGEGPSQIVFTHNATESLNLAIKGLINKEDHVITTVMEHNSVLRPLYQLEENGTELTILEMSDEGVIDPRVVETAIKTNTRALVITHASNVTGNINPLKEIGQILKKHDVLLIVDASQTMGAIPIDVQDIGVDVLCFTGHKSLLGPQGTGGLYVNPNVTIRPFKTGGTGVDTFNKHHYPEMPTSLEAGTLNSHGIAGLLASVKYIMDEGIDNICEDECRKAEYFYQQLQTIPNLTFYGNYQQNPKCPIISLNVAGVDSTEVSDWLLNEAGIVTRSGGHCAPLMHLSHQTMTRGMVRFSLSLKTSYEDIDQVVACLRQFVDKKVDNIYE